MQFPAKINEPTGVGPWLPGYTRDVEREIERAIERMTTTLATSPAEKQAERVVYSTYGDTVSVVNKAKNLNKFGRNATVGTNWETVAELQGTESDETFVSTNLIDGISSSDQLNDVGLVITIEGHTIDGSGNLTFVTQDATLDATDARTEVTLTTPLARATRAYVKNSGTFNSPQAVPTGTIYIYDNTGGVSAGVPSSASGTKLTISAGETQSKKAATTISSTDYWFIGYFSAGIGVTGAASVDRIVVRMETRDVANGGVWRPMALDIVLVPGQNDTFVNIDPMLIVPKNHDWRIRAKTNANTAEIFAEAGGPLASIST